MDQTILTPDFTESYMQPPQNKIQPALRLYMLRKPQLLIKYIQIVKIKHSPPFKLTIATAVLRKLEAIPGSSFRVQHFCRSHQNTE